MAKSKPTNPPPIDDIRPADGFVSPAPGEDDTQEIVTPTPVQSAEADTQEIVTPTPVQSAEADELAALRAEVAKLKAEKAKAAETMGAGKFLVRLKDGPTAVVECEAGEHPFEKFKALTGVTNSINPPEVTRAKADAAVGIVR